MPAEGEKKASTRDSLINRFLDTHYTRMLKWALSHRKISVIAAVCIMLSTIPSVIFVGKDFIPRDDRSEFSIHVKAPVGTSIAAMDSTMSKIEDDIRKMKGVTHILTTVGSGENKAVNDGDIYVRLVDIKERDFTQKEAMAGARKILAAYPALRTSVLDVGGAGGGSESEFQVRLTGISLEELKAYSEKLMAKMRAKKGFVDVDTTSELGKPEVKVNIDRQKAADLGVRVNDIASALQLYISGEKDITKYKVEDELYEVRVRLSDKDRNSTPDILGLTVPASLDKNGEKRVRLDQVASIDETVV